VELRVAETFTAVRRYERQGGRVWSGWLVVERGIARAVDLLNALVAGDGCVVPSVVMCVYRARSRYLRGSKADRSVICDSKHRHPAGSSALFEDGKGPLNVPLVELVSDRAREPADCWTVEIRNGMLVKRSRSGRRRFFCGGKSNSILN
jgi:hypothetical protein